MTKLTPERREEVSQIILDQLLEEGNVTEDEQRSALLGVAKRLKEVSQLTGLPVEEVEAFCWEMVEHMTTSQEKTEDEELEEYYFHHPWELL